MSVLLHYTNNVFLFGLTYKTIVGGKAFDPSRNFVKVINKQAQPKIDLYHLLTKVQFGSKAKAISPSRYTLIYLDIP